MAALRQQERAAVAEGIQVDAAIADLALRKAEMVEELAAVETARRAAQASGRDPKVDRKVQRAEAAFERARKAAGANVTVGNEPASAAEAEIAALRSEDAAAERLAALKAGNAQTARPRAKAR